MGMERGEGCAVLHVVVRAGGGPGGAGKDQSSIDHLRWKVGGGEAGDTAACRTGAEMEPTRRMECRGGGDATGDRGRKHCEEVEAAAADRGGGTRTAVEGAEAGVDNEPTATAGTLGVGGAVCEGGGDGRGPLLAAGGREGGEGRAGRGWDIARGLSKTALGGGGGGGGGEDRVGVVGLVVGGEEVYMRM